jgi:O-antigen/teichoic acid export membrane protein
VGIRFVMMPFGGSFVAFHRQDINNMLNICEDLIRTAAIVILLFYNYGLVEMATAVLIVNSIRQIISVIILKNLYPEIRFSLELCDLATLKSLFHYSKIAFGISAAWMLIFNSDSLLLGIVSSSAAAGIFNPAIQVMFHLRLLVSSISIPLTPAVSHLGTTTDLATIGRMYLRSLKYVSYLIFMVCTGVVIYADPFVSLWLPKEFLPASDVMKVLAISGAFYLPQILGNSVLLGLDKHRYLLIVLTIEVTAKIILALFLIKPFGLIGMAIATAVPQLILYTFIYPNYVAKVLGMTFSQIMRPVLVSGLTAVLVTGLTSFLLHQWLSPWTWKTLIINVAIILAANIIPILFIVEKKDWDKIRKVLKIK